MDLGNGWWLQHVQCKYVVWKGDNYREFSAKNMQEAIRKAKEIIKEMEKTD